MSKATPYSESKDHVPNPMHQYDSVDTTGTTGDLGGRIDTISPVFEQARAEALARSVEALEDPTRDTSAYVVFPEENRSREDAEKALRHAAKEVGKSEVLRTGKSEAELEAAEKGEPRNPSEASAAQGVGVGPSAGPALGSAGRSASSSHSSSSHSSTAHKAAAKSTAASHKPAGKRAGS